MKVETKTLLGLVLASTACSSGIIPDDALGSGGETGSVIDENSPLCAPFEVDVGETGEPFPPEGESARLYVCEGSVDVDITGIICLDQKNDHECKADKRIELLPIGEPPTLMDEAIGIPSPMVDSSIEMWPTPEIGACCVADDMSPAFEEAVDTVCQADCGARACEAAADLLLAAITNPACLYPTVDPEHCELVLPMLCNDLGICVQSQLLGRSVNDITAVIDQLRTPEGFQTCQNSIRSDAGWKPCLPEDSLCQNPPAIYGPGRVTDMTFFANCAGIEPVFSDPPDPAADCTENPNANVGAAFEGEAFGGPLVGGSLELVTPLGDATPSIVGSSIAFRRLPCETDPCLFSLTELELEFDSFSLGPFTVNEMTARLASPALGQVWSDGSATIDSGVLRMSISLDASVNNKKSFGGKPLPHGHMPPILITNDGPVTLVIEPNNEIEVIEANFAFPFDVDARVATEKAQCAPQD